MIGHVAVTLDELLGLIEEELRVGIDVLEEFREVPVETDFVHDLAHLAVDTRHFIETDLVVLAVSLALAMLLAYGIALAMDWGHAFWAGFAVAFCGLTGVGDSLNKGLLRVFGTLFGAAAGLALLAMFPQDRWSFMTAMSIFIAFCTYMMGGTTRWYFWFMAAITVPIVTVTAEPDAIYNFNRAILRSQQTTLGIVVYSLVSVLIWPVSSRGAFDGAVRKVIGNQRRLFTHYMAHLLGAPDDKSSVQLRIEATRTLGGLGALLDHAELDTLEIWEVRRQGRCFVTQMTNL